MSTSNDTTIHVPLTLGLFAVIDKEDEDLLISKWSARPSKKRVYAQRGIRKNKRSSTEQMHRVILSRILGRPLTTDEFVDHIDRDGLNNRRSNLRLSNNSTNLANQGRPVTNTTGYKGVYWNKKLSKWTAKVAHIYLGVFGSPEDAFEAYKKKATEMYGEFARFE